VIADGRLTAHDAGAGQIESSWRISPFEAVGPGLGAAARLLVAAAAAPELVQSAERVASARRPLEAVHALRLEGDEGHARGRSPYVVDAWRPARQAARRSAMAAVSCRRPRTMSSRACCRSER
jgi:hypothetical protein